MPGHTMDGLSDKVFDATDAQRSLAGANADLSDVDVVSGATTGRLGKARQPSLAAN
ncbi:hypothetical protein [Chitinimonas koreensis]|uniref:hypothetical protein n=1 Tax=Chitinimonas koreensis TaxID=356302 RepID=UPI0012F9B4CC|nr:hypothetical protein [Chitinimonas koreensis]QNM98480.1 hypothetical protein H9L41_09745 [Chitinimonas koreensis]